MRMMLLLVLICWQLPNVAWAQGGSPFGPNGGRRPATLGAPQGFGQSSPSVSPYLNLLRSNNNNTSTVANYYGFVRPAQDFNNALQGLQSQLSSVEGSTLDLNAGQATGSRVRFLNLGGYFQSLGGSTGGGLQGTRFSGNVGTNFGGRAGSFNPGSFGTPVQGPNNRVVAPMGSSAN